jgi:hypothetical protein
VSADAGFDPAESLYQRLRDGRARLAVPCDLDNFYDVLANGPLRAQQALLGLIGLSYHPEYRPLLDAALRSHEPSIRVHAAAVSVKLRQRFKTELQSANTALADSSRGDEGYAIAVTLREIARSGFLNEVELAAAKSAALAACCQHLAAHPRDSRAQKLRLELLVDMARWNEAFASLQEAERTGNAIVGDPALTCLMQFGCASRLNALLAEASVLQLHVGEVARAH